MDAEASMARKGMTDDHKQALADGRAEGRAVKVYLDALEANKPRRGRRRTKASIGERIAAIDVELASASSLKRLLLIQERRDLEAELAAMGTAPDLSGAEADFVKAAKSYGERKGIAYATWRELGVSAEVLKKAGITRGG
jgi:hypothetical protein